MAYKHPYVPLQNGSTSIGESLLLGPILPSRKLRLRQAQHRARGNLPASHLYPPLSALLPANQGLRPQPRLAGCSWLDQEGLAGGEAASADSSRVRCLTAWRLRGSVCLLCVSFFPGLKRRRWTKNQAVKQAHVWSQPKPKSLLIIRMRYVRGVLLSDAPNDTDGPVL